MLNFEWAPEIKRAPASGLSYLDTLGLERHPFPVAPDDEHFYVSANIEQMVAEIVHGIEARKGFMVISGDVGLGKTTITRRILKILNYKQVNTSLVFHTSLKDVDLLREINRDFGMADEVALSSEGGLGYELQRLNSFLLSQYRQGNNCAIIIDDAQNLDRASLELVRMISNLEADCRKLVQILLVGQPELTAKLGMPELRQLQSRIFISKAVRPLNRDELRTYILFKLSLAGNQGRITVSQDALRHLYRHTGGNFRQVNMLMDRCLYALCTDGGKQIDHRTVQTAHADLHHHEANRRRPMAALAASVALPILLIVTGWLVHLYTSGGATASERASSQYYKVPSNDVRLPPHADGPLPISAQIPTMAASEQFDPAVVDFLRSKQLEAHTAEFERALSEGSVSLWAERIYRQNGLQLVQLPSLPDSVRRRYGALALPSASGEVVTWLLFWEPAVSIHRFYYGYQGKEIAALQQWLTAVRLYHRKIDGVVGPHLMKALVAFQTRSGLPVTGFPNAETLFTLFCQQEGLS